MNKRKENFLIVAARENKSLTKKESRKFLSLLLFIYRDVIRYTNNPDLVNDSYSIRYFQNLLQVHQDRLVKFYKEIKRNG